jgi:hypothetical protein
MGLPVRLEGSELIVDKNRRGRTATDNLCRGLLKACKNFRVGSNVRFMSVDIIACMIMYYGVINKYCEYLDVILGHVVVPSCMILDSPDLGSWRCKSISSQAVWSCRREPEVCGGGGWSRKNEKRSHQNLPKRARERKRR